MAQAERWRREEIKIEPAPGKNNVFSLAGWLARSHRYTNINKALASSRIVVAILGGSYYLGRLAHLSHTNTHSASAVRASGLIAARDGLWPEGGGFGTTFAIIIVRMPQTVIRAASESRLRAISLEAHRASRTAKWLVNSGTESHSPSAGGKNSPLLPPAALIIVCPTAIWLADKPELSPSERLAESP